MYKFGGRAVNNISRGRLLSQETTESSSCFLSFANSQRTFSSAHYSKGPRSDHSNHQTSYGDYANPPEPIPNRPLRGERKTPPVYSSRQPDQQPPRVRFTGKENPEKDRGTLEDSEFLEKFKLGFDRKTENPLQKQSPRYSQKGTDKSDNSSEVPTPPPEDADAIFKKMKETGLIPNAVAMLDGLCKDGLVQEAMKLFGLMRERGTMPEVVIYTAVVEGFCKAQKLDDAIRIFRKMKSNGIAPNAFSYNILVQWLCKVKRLDEAVEFCSEMLEAGQSPNIATFTGLVDGYSREKGPEEAESMINSMRQKGFHIDEKVYREYLEKKGPFSPAVWEAILGKKASQRSSLFH